ncbi:MAG: hypothetical protein AAFS10_22895, partial [Myxococcota bacterium]
YAGHLIAMATRHRGIIPMIDELLTSSSGNEFFKVQLPERLANKPVRDVERILREDYNATLVGIEHVEEDYDGKRIQVNPPVNQFLAPGTLLIVIAEKAPSLS